MKIARLLKNKKAISAVVSTIFIIGVTVAAVGIIYVMTNPYLEFNSSIDEGGSIEAFDFDGDGLIDSVSMSLINEGMSDAKIESITMIQNGNEFLWHSLDLEIDLGSLGVIDMYALGNDDQLIPFLPFHVEIVFNNEYYTSPGYTATIASEVPDEIIPEIIIEDPIVGGDDDDEDEDEFVFKGYDFLVSRTKADDEYSKNKFPTSVGYSPNRWFILGEFDDNNKRADLDTDYIDLCDHGDELEYQPYLLDGREFDDGKIGTQSGNLVMPYLDGGEHPGLISLNKYGKWDKQDDLNWGKRGIVYMWSYIYVTGTETQTVSISANGASEFAVYLNGDFQVEGNKKNKWYTNNGVTLNPGLNMVLMKISAKTNAHFAGQVLFFNNANLANYYSVWPTFNDL